MSLFGGKSKSKTNEVQTGTLDPLARGALEQVLGKSQELFNSNAPIFAGLDPASVAGLQFLQDRPIAPFIPTAADELGRTLSGGGLNPFNSAFAASNKNLVDTLSGGFFESGENPALGAIEDRIRRNVEQSVGDQFTASGRTGSPANFDALGRGITQELSPFLFEQFNRDKQFRDNERQRQLQASQLAQQGFAGERGNQLSAFGLIPGVDQALDSQATRLLGVGDVLQAEQQKKFDTPFTRFERFSNPLIAAAGGFPVTLTRDATGKISEKGFKF